MSVDFHDQKVISAKRLELFCCHSNTSLGDAAKKMVEEDISSLVVVDPDGYLIGIISRRDFMPLVMSSPDWRVYPVARCMSKHVITVTGDSSLADVAARLLEQRIHRVVVIDGEPGRPRPIAVISDSDLLYHLVHQSE